MNNIKNLKQVDFKNKIKSYLIKLKKENLIQIKIQDNLYTFKINYTGNYTATKSKAQLKNKLITFEYFGKNISIYSDMITFNFGIYKFIQLAKIYSLVENKLYYKAFSDFKYHYTNSLFKSINYHFKKEEYLNFLIESQLGSFENEEIDYTLELITSKFFQENKKFYTHVVGIRYYIDVAKIVEYKNKKLYLVWENENKYDQNAIVALDENANKIGYIRRTISKYLVSKFRYKPVLNATVLDTDENNIYIEVNIENS